MKQPNILIFLVDQLQYDSTTSTSQCLMPVLQGFKEQAVNFTHAYTSSPHCCPSRATLMTGSYPSRHSIFNNVDIDCAHSHEINAGVRTFSQDLVTSGYLCSYSGKYHISKMETPKDRCWKEVSRFDYYHEPFCDKAHSKLLGWGNWKDVDKTDDTPSGQRPPATIQRPGWGDIGPFKQVAGSDALEREFWYQNAIAPGIEEIGRLAEQTAPWCLCISDDMSPESDVPQDIYDLYDVDTISLPENFSDDFSDKPNVYRRMREIRGQLSEAEYKQHMAQYWSNCTLQDRYFERILKALDESGQADDTMVIFMSDHGEYNAAHGLSGMNIPCFREAYHIPLIIRMPKSMRTDLRTVPHFTSIADVAPTLIELAGMTSQDQKTGCSVLPLLKGETVTNWRDALYTQTDGNDVHYMQRAVITEKWRYVYNTFDFDELYDLDNDPMEMNNLIYPSKHPQPAWGSVGRQGTSQPWPHLPQNLDDVRKEMMGRIWSFAKKEQDHIFFKSHVAAYGPGTESYLS